MNRLATTFSAFRYGNYRWYWVGMFFSFASHPMQQLSKGWLAYEITSSPLALGLVNVAHGIPLLALSFLGGTIADRMSKRRLIIASESVQGFINLIIALLVVMGLIKFWHLVLSNFFSGVASAFRAPVRQSIVPELVDKRDMMNAIAMNSVGNNLAQILAPAVGGVLIAIYGMSVNFFIVAGLFFASSLTMTRVTTTFNGDSEKENIKEEMAQGIKYLRSSPAILSLFMMVLVITLFGSSYQFMLPVFAKDILNSGPRELGWMMSMTGAGAILGALLIAFLGDLQRKGLLQMGLAFILGSALVLFSLSRYLPLSLLFLLGVGMGNTGFNAINNTLLLSLAEPRFRGRVMAISVMSHSLRSIGALPMGAVAEVWGVPLAVGGGGAIVALYTVIMNFAYPRLRKL